MALQGNLRDFSATEILQLLGMQHKSGCLLLERASERVLIFVTDGRIVSTRLPGMVADDPLMRFLLKIHRLSSDQHQGIVSIQKESGRDLEDILLNGRYLDAEELTAYLERQILDDVTRVVRWDSGSYRFEPSQRWNQVANARLNVEGAIIEAARRVDESRRCADQFADPEMLLGVRDLPDPDEPLAEEERELFGIIDGRHTLAEVVEAAPLTESEAYEAIDAMLRAHWIEFVGRRETAPKPTGPLVVLRPETERAPVVRRSFAKEVLLAVAIVIATVVLFQAASVMRSHLEVREDDVFVTSQIRDLRYALELFKRERGQYPTRLEELVGDRWISPSQLRVPGHRLYYHLTGSDRAYDLKLEREL